MTATKTRKRPGKSKIVLPPAAWPEAEIIGWPIDQRELTEPQVIVKRNIPDIAGPNGERIFVQHGAGKHISLFTGCGGMDLGVEMAGFETVVQHEWDHICCETLLANRPRCFRYSALIQGDITKTPTSMILDEAGLRVGEADLLTGGPPCQGFSTAGRRDENDIRNTLVFEFLRVVRQAQPKFFVMENVPGFVSLAKNRFLQCFLEMAYQDCYYELVYGLVNAVEYGVPQSRCRFICMGTRRDLAEIDGTLACLPRPTSYSQRDLKDVVFLAQRPLMSDEFNLLTHPPGIRYFPDRPVLIPPQPTRGRDIDDSGRSAQFLRFYEKLMRDEPDRIVTHPQAAEQWPDGQDKIKDNFEAGRWITVQDAIGDLANVPLVDRED